MKTHGILLDYDSLTGVGRFVLASKYRTPFAALVASVPKGAVWDLNMGKYFPNRSTGRHSQNNHMHGHAAQIAAVIGDSMEDVLHEACLKTADYPFHVSKLSGKPVPQSTSKATTQQAAAVIETLHRIAVFLGITLKEE